jgi:hypothetical protein
LISFHATAAASIFMPLRFSEFRFTFRRWRFSGFLQRFFAFSWPSQLFFIFFRCRFFIQSFVEVVSSPSLPTPFSEPLF